MKADDAGFFDSSFYNLFKNGRKEDWGKENGCSSFAFFIPVGEEDKMEICDGDGYEEKNEQHNKKA